jgi:hypothetical protein
VRFFKRGAQEQSSGGDFWAWWTADLPDELSGAAARQIKVGFGRGMDWSFERKVGIR